MKTAALSRFCALAACAAAARLAGASPVSGYFGNRSGVYSNVSSPIAWGEGTNVLWKVPVPNLGSAAPLIAPDPEGGGGGRVFVLSEPGWKHDLPVISCYDADTGALKWEKEIDHLHLTVPDETARRQVREAWHNHLAWCRDFYRLYHDYSSAADKTEARRRMDEMGIVKWGANYLFGGLDEAKASEFSMPRFEKAHPEVRKAMVEMDTWRRMGSHDFMWIGEVFGTPATDGNAVYVATAWGVYASYDLDGNLRWMHALPPNRPHDYCSVARSPLIHGDFVISDLGRMVRAFDRRSGELKWERRREGGVHEFVSPVVFRVGGRDLLWCAGPAAYLLPEGTPVAIDGWNNNGMIVAVNTDRPDTLFFTGGGEHGGWEGKGNCPHPPPAAVRFTLEGDPATTNAALKARVLWNRVNGHPAAGCVGMLYHGGKLYFSGAKGTILDAETGVVVKGLYGGAVPTANHHMAIAGGHVYGLSENGVMEVHGLDGRRLARNRLRVTPFGSLDADSQAKRLSQWYSWPKAENRDWCFTYSGAFAVAGESAGRGAGRIYIRSLDHLYCIAEKGEALPAPAGDANDAESLITEAESGRDVWGRLAAAGPAAKGVVPRIEALLTKHREPWRLVGVLAEIDPNAARRHRDLLVKAIVDSNLNDHLTPQAAEVLYDLGLVPREMLEPIEARVDERMYPINGPRQAQDLLSACYARSGEVGFTQVQRRPLPWEGVPERGKEVRLTWKAINADKVTLEPGVGAVAVEGERTVTLNESAVYTFTAEGRGGRSVRRIEVPIRVTVREFRADPGRTAAGGEIALKWNVVNADAITIEPGIGAVDARGEKKLACEKTTEFALRATGPGGPATAKVTVSVAGP